MGPRPLASLFSLLSSSLLLTGCGSNVAGPPSFAAGTVEGVPTNPDIYIDVESKAELGGIPYYVEGGYKVSVATFAEYPGTPPTLDKRVAFTGLKYGTDGFIGIDRAFTGDVEFRVTVGVKSTEEFAGSYVAGYIVMNFPPIKKYGDSDAHSYLGANWDEFAQGFSMQAWDSNAPVGFPVTIPDAKQVDLRLTRTGGNVVMSTRKTPPSPEEEGGWVDVITVADPLPLVDCSLEFGAEGLHSGAQIFFDYFYVGGPTVGGAAETSPMEHMRQARDIADLARGLVDQDTPDFENASEMLTNALTQVGTAKEEIDTAIEGDTFQSGTRDALARKAAERARKALVKARDWCDDGVATKKKSILKFIADGRGHATVTIANLAGVKTSTWKKLPIPN